MVLMLGLAAVVAASSLVGYGLSRGMAFLWNWLRW